MPVLLTAEVIAQKNEILKSIFDMLIETTGIHGGKESRYLKYHREEFMESQLKEETFAFEYWFPANASDDMKLLYNRFRGFSVITQHRTAKGIEAAEKANARLVEMGYAV